MGRKFTIFALFYFVFEGKFQVQAPRGGLYSEGRFNAGFWALRFWGAYIFEWRIHGGAYFRNFTVPPCLVQHPQCYYPVQGNGQDARRLVLKQLIGNCNRVNPERITKHALDRQKRT